MTAAGDRLLADAEDRRRAQSEFERPVVVVAGAGTGKTALLVARAVAWCVGPGWERHRRDGDDPARIARKVIERTVAITFTEAAAAEMAHKIGTALLDLAGGAEPTGWDPDSARVPADDETLRARARALAEESHRLVVATIHAFCQRLLSTYPLEAGLHPRFEVDADGTGLERLAEEVVEEELREVEHDRRHWQRLAREGVGPTGVVEALCRLVEAGATSGSFEDDPFGADASARAAARLRMAAERFRFAVGRRLDAVSGEVSQAARDAGVAVLSGLDLLDPKPPFDDLVDAVSAIDPRVVPRLEKWSRLQFTKGEAEGIDGAEHLLAAAAGELAAALGPLAASCREQLDAARRVAASLLAKLDGRRAAAGLVTFSDLLRRAVELLEGSRGVRREVVAGIDHLLVDEFQDTDVVQCRLVELLALSGEPAERPSLFIVGDPKQSIYAWRDADLAAYDDFVDRVVAAGGVTVDLVRNFRSVTPILDEVERLVAPVMREEKGIQPPFQRLEATEERRDAAGIDHERWRTVEHWLSWPLGEHGVAPEKGNSDRLTSPLEAEAIAADIVRLRREGVLERWGDAAVLLRVTTAQETLLDAFREHGIPYDVAREREYYRQREVVELAALIRCVLEPTDVLALLTVLRSDVVGVPDAALVPLWDAGLPSDAARLEGPDPQRLQAVRDAIAEAAAQLPPSPPGLDAVPRWAEALASAIEVVAALRSSLRDDPPDLFVEKVRTLWLAEVTAAARHLGGFRRARVDRFLSELEATLSAGEGGDAALARFLRVAVEEGRESRVPVPPDIERDAVHVMTIHRAKGLDFEHVYVAQIHKGGRGGRDRAAAKVRWLDGRPEYRLFGWETPGFATAEWIQDRKTRAEIVRLLYVAATRAKRRLVLSGGWGPPGESVPAESAADFAGLIGRRLDAAAVSRQLDAGSERAAGGEPHVLRVVPAFAEPFPPAPAAASAAVSAGAEGLETARALAAARRAADRRMAADVVRSASAEAHQRLQRAQAEESDPAGDAAADRDRAMAVGTLVHDLLEHLDLEGDLPDQVRTAPEPEGAGALLQRLADGRCLARLAELAPRVVGRELAVLSWDEPEEAPPAVVSGFIDLVYRDPEDDRLVVADYKTDRVDDDAALADRSEAYAPQIRTYARALGRALSLDYDPACELWFLHADRIVRI
jgi:ATP-dependent helicase/nuclease subunit A